MWRIVQNPDATYPMIPMKKHPINRHHKRALLWKRKYYTVRRKPNHIELATSTISPNWWKMICLYTVKPMKVRNCLSIVNNALFGFWSWVLKALVCCFLMGSIHTLSYTGGELVIHYSRLAAAVARRHTCLFEQNGQHCLILFKNEEENWPVH
jgi:hypothetical protein